MEQGKKLKEKIKEKNIHRHYIAIYGSNYVMDKTIEELLELGTEIAKYKNSLSKHSIQSNKNRKKKQPKEIMAELADVELRLSQLKMILSTKGLQKSKKKKLKAWKERLLAL